MGISKHIFILNHMIQGVFPHMYYTRLGRYFLICIIFLTLSTAHQPLSISNNLILRDLYDDGMRYGTHAMAYVLSK